MVRVTPYVVHSILVLISDYYLWKVGNRTVGKHATAIAFAFHLTNRMQNNFLTRCFTNSIEEILNIIGFWFYLEIGSRVNKAALIFTGIVSI
mmetsp:Transcript_15469/g.23769  ORF Transcript_15469/g.23769 Transcript_15469/m.23769 type:complete len:92 (-) Transcript_15469:1118-1393(-)